MRTIAIAGETKNAVMEIAKIAAPKPTALETSAVRMDPAHQSRSAVKMIMNVMAQAAAVMMEPAWILETIWIAVPVRTRILAKLIFSYGHNLFASHSKDPNHA